MLCSNGVINGGEACDDGNLVGTDGCLADCTQDPNYGCPTPGSPCILLCSNRVIDGTEACDDGNLGVSDGCTGSC
jgi:cysteine-rich repeat protein